MTEKIPLSQKEKTEFYCENCNYVTLNKKDFMRHLNTKKHEKKVAGIVAEETTEKPQLHNKYQCDHCLHIYKDKTGLWRHKKKCSLIMNETPLPSVNKSRIQDDTTPEVNKDLVLELIKQNKELQSMIIEQNQEHSKHIMELAKTQTSIINSNNTTTNNQQFNLQFFLNEKCKDAMNIVDFMKSIKLNVEDFEATGRLGYADGISRIFINALKNMEVAERPIHCTDIKRETLYIKDKDRWEKETPNKDKFKRVVDHIAKLNLNQLPYWQDQHPEYMNINTRDNDTCLNLSLAALGGKTIEEDEKFMDKIIKNVMKEVVVNKKDIVI